VWSGKAQFYGGAVSQGGQTSVKAATNTAVGTLTLGYVNEAIPVTDGDLGYDGARAGFEVASLLNPLDKLGKAGKLFGKLLSYADDINSVGQGAYGIYQDGLDAGDLQSLAGGLPGPRRPNSKNGGVLGVMDDAPGPKGGTYRLRDPADDVVKRTGRSKDLDERRRDHANNPETKDLDFEVDRRTDVYAEQRGREQIIHDAHPEALLENGGLNKIRGISPKNPRLEEYLEAGRRLDDG
jgi:hypothetical protein